MFSKTKIVTDCHEDSVRITGGLCSPARRNGPGNLCLAVMALRPESTLGQEKVFYPPGRHGFAPLPQRIVLTGKGSTCHQGSGWHADGGFGHFSDGPHLYEGIDVR